MNDSSEKTKRLAMTLKFAGVVLATLAGPLGAWYTARSQARADLETGYKVLAESTADLKKAIEQIQANEKTVWRKTQSDAKETKPDVRPPSRPRAIRAPRTGLISLGAGSGGAAGTTSGVMGAVASAPFTIGLGAEPLNAPAPAAPPVVSVKQTPMDLQGALNAAAK